MYRTNPKNPFKSATCACLNKTIQNIKQQQGGSLRFAPQGCCCFKEKVNVNTGNHPCRQGKPEPDFTPIPPLQKRKPGRSRGSLPDMSAGQPAKPLCGACFAGSPRCRARARPHCFSPAGSRLTCVRRSGFAPAHRKPVGSGARSRSHAFPRFRRGRPWAGSAPTTGGTPAPAGSPGPVSVPDAPHPGGTRSSVSPIHQRLSLPGGGRPAFGAPTLREPRLQPGEP